MFHINGIIQYMVSCVLLFKSNSFLIDPQSSEFTLLHLLHLHPTKFRLTQTCSFENIFLPFLWIMPNYPIMSASHPSFPFTLFWGITTIPSSLGHKAPGSLSYFQSSSHDCTEEKGAFFPIWSPRFSLLFQHHKLCFERK